MATLEREPAFRILHVNLMFGKYWRGVTACMYFYYVCKKWRKRSREGRKSCKKNNCKKCSLG